MSERNIQGVGINLNMEYTDEEGYHRCIECETKTMLVTSPSYWSVDREAFKPGEESPEDTPEHICAGEVSGHWCPKCEVLVSLTYNFI